MDTIMEVLKVRCLNHFKSNIILIILDIQKKISNPVKEVFKKIWLKFHGRNGLSLNITDFKLIRPNHPTNCLTLDLIKIPELNLEYLSQIQFSFLKMPKYQVEVKMEDRLYSLSRQYKYNKFGNSGPKMDLMNLSKKKGGRLGKENIHLL